MIIEILHLFLPLLELEVSGKSHYCFFIIALTFGECIDPNKKLENVGKLARSREVSIAIVLQFVNKKELNL